MKVKQTAAGDRAVVERLIAAAPWAHVHLDWQDPTSLTNKKPFLLASHRGIRAGLLGCPPDLPEFTWLRTFAAAEGFGLDEVWDVLWTAAVELLRELGIHLVAAVSLEEWFSEIILKAGFNRTNSVIFYERELEPSILTDEFHYEIRSIHPTDENLILELDHLAFDPIWRLSGEALSVALIQASSASLIEHQGKILGYQITTASPFGAHLSRLAVRPSNQRAGLGTALVKDAIEDIREFGLGQLSVNTQEDNMSSRKLYEKLGFRITGKEFPVFEMELSANP